MSLEFMPPIVVMPSLTCNNHCRFCYLQGHKQQSPQDSVDFTGLERFVAEHHEATLLLSGGEPTIHPQFWSLLEGLLELPVASVLVETNGRMFSSPKFYHGHEKLLNEARLQFRVAWQNSTAAGHDYLTQTAGSYSQTVRGLRNLRDVQARLSVSTLLLRSNVFSLGEMAHVLAGMHIPAWYWRYPHSQEQIFLPQYYFVQEQWLKISPEYPKLNIQLENIPFHAVPELPAEKIKPIILSKEIIAWDRNSRLSVSLLMSAEKITHDDT